MFKTFKTRSLVVLVPYNILRKLLNFLTKVSYGHGFGDLQLRISTLLFCLGGPRIYYVVDVINFSSVALRIQMKDFHNHILRNRSNMHMDQVFYIVLCKLQIFIPDYALNNLVKIAIVPSKPQKILAWTYYIVLWLVLGGNLSCHFCIKLLLDVCSQIMHMNFSLQTLTKVLAIVWPL